MVRNKQRKRSEEWLNTWDSLGKRRRVLGDNNNINGESENRFKKPDADAVIRNVFDSENIDFEKDENGNFRLDRDGLPFFRNEKREADNNNSNEKFEPVGIDPQHLESAGRTTLLLKDKIILPEADKSSKINPKSRYPR